MKWAITHDFWFDRGGAERVTRVMQQALPSSHHLTVIAGDQESLARDGLGKTHILFPRISKRTYRQMSFAYPYAVARHAAIDGNALCSSYAFAHHFRCTGSKVVYCHSPLRQIWSGLQMYSQHHAFYRGAAAAVGAHLRRLDREVARSADLYIANSNAVRDRIASFYGLAEVPVVYPPVSNDFAWSGSERTDDFVWAGRIVEPYKKLGLVLEAFKDLPYRLIVVGDGRDRRRLESTASPNVTFVGKKNAEELSTIYSFARAVVFPSEDDFGLIPVEAMRCGAPIIAYGGGGALETVIDQETGVFFQQQTIESLRACIGRFMAMSFENEYIVEYSKRFSEASFVSKMNAVLEAV
ncbi:glycosyltransferase [Pseudonocardia spirodelae]|uniref:Glycosyltransferase n=1 Tax=Pseudonocardia spirodelae TaxID=3133431 RepID=A0ABU8T2V4_9PSEU